MKNKKLLATALLSLALGLVGCGGGEGDGEPTGDEKAPVETCKDHKWSGWETVKQATCVEKGSKERKCTVCGTVDPKEIPISTTHDWEQNFSDATHVPVTATCNVAAKTFKQCKVCKTIEEIPGEKLAHDFEEAVDQPANSECNTPTKIASCKNCDTVKVNWRACDVDEAITSPKTDTNLKNTYNTTTGSAKFGGTEYNKGQVETEGSHLGYSVYVPNKVAKAKLSFRVKLHNQTGVVFDAVPNDNAPGYIKVGEEFVQSTKRYALDVNGVNVELGDDPYTNEDASNEGWYEFPCEFALNKGANEIVLKRMGGYRAEMFEFALEFEVINHNEDEHTWVAATAPTQGADDVDLKKYVCDCGLIKYEINAVDAKGEFATGSSIKNKTPEGYLKLAGNGQSISYKFNLDKGFNGKIYQYGFIDSYSSNKNNKIYYNGSGNVEVKVNDNVVDISSMVDKKFSDVFGEDADSSGNSVEKNVLVGDVSLAAGENTLVFKRTQSLNLSVKSFVIIGEEGCSHSYIADTNKTDVAPTCETDGVSYFVCEHCGQTKEVPANKLGHDMEEVAEADLDATHQLSAGSCSERAVTAWKKCKNEGCDHWEAVLGGYGADHDFGTDGTNPVCSVCHGYKVELASDPDCNLWESSGKMNKGGKGEFSVTVSTAGEYVLQMFFTKGSGQGTTLMSAREVSLSINGTTVNPTNSNMSDNAFGLTADVSAVEISRVTLNQGSNSIIINFGSGANYRYTIKSDDARCGYFMLIPVNA